MCKCANKHKENRKGIKTTLYDARAETTRQETASTLDAILNSGTSNHAIGIINPEPIHFTNTLYGTMPVGSTLSHQYSRIPVYCSVPLFKERLHSGTDFALLTSGSYRT